MEIEGRMMERKSTRTDRLLILWSTRIKSFRALKVSRINPFLDFTHSRHYNTICQMKDSTRKLAK